MVLIGSIKSFSKDNVVFEKSEKQIYEILGPAEEVLYIGVGNLRLNLEQHLKDGWFPIPEGKYYRTFGTTDDPHLLTSRKDSLLSDYEDILGQIPKYNEKERR